MHVLFIDCIPTAVWTIIVPTIIHVVVWIIVGTKRVVYINAKSRRIVLLK
jgi:hypothetical protein